MPTWLWKRRLKPFLLGLDVLANGVVSLIFGGTSYQTISCRIGFSIATGGWAARIPWPAWWRNHCTGSMFVVVF